MKYSGRTFLFAAILGLMTVASNAVADEAPTILIEDVILTCAAEAQSLAMPTTEAPPLDERYEERRIHRVTAQFCQGKTVCRIKATSLLTGPLEHSPCSDVTIVPVCATGAFVTTIDGASTEMTLLFRASSTLVINCSGKANPHF